MNLIKKRLVKHSSFDKNDTINHWKQAYKELMSFSEELKQQLNKNRKEYENAKAIIYQWEENYPIEDVEDLAEFINHENDFISECLSDPHTLFHHYAVASQYLGGEIESKVNKWAKTFLKDAESENFYTSK